MHLGKIHLLRSCRAWLLSDSFGITKIIPTLLHTVKTLCISQFQLLRFQNKYKVLMIALFCCFSRLFLTQADTNPRLASCYGFLHRHMCDIVQWLCVYWYCNLICWVTFFCIKSYNRPDRYMYVVTLFHLQKKRTDL